ncbi:MAG: response regulator [Betaproteobacteria bacterium]|nr:MAG: response regulator [Betaproteobacteria bacterium]
MEATKKVLVIDDDPVVGKSFQRVLGGKGYAVISAASGAEALDRLAREDYDVVYADIKMPGMDGLEVTERIKASRPWLPVVIVTGYGSQENEARAAKLGVAGFLNKPLSPDMIEGSAQLALMQEAKPAAAKAGTQAGPVSFIKNVGLFIAAPFIGLAYVVAFPFIGLGLLGWLAIKALAHRGVDVDQPSSPDSDVR